MGSVAELTDVSLRARRRVAWRLLPFLFVHTGSVAIDELHARMQATRRRAATTKAPAVASQLASAGE